MTAISGPRRAHQLGRHARHRAHSIRIARLWLILCSWRLIPRRRPPFFRFAPLAKPVPRTNRPWSRGPQAPANPHRHPAWRCGFGNHRGFARRSKGTILADATAAIAGRPPPRGNAARARLSKPSACDGFGESILEHVLTSNAIDRDRARPPHQRPPTRRGESARAKSARGM